MSDPAAASYQFERVGDFDGNGFYDAVRVIARADGTSDVTLILTPTPNDGLGQPPEPLKFASPEDWGLTAEVKTRVGQPIEVQSVALKGNCYLGDPRQDSVAHDKILLERQADYDPADWGGVEGLSGWSLKEHIDDQKPKGSVPSHNPTSVVTGTDGGMTRTFSTKFRYEKAKPARSADTSSVD